jgi:adenylate cyclase, class 2
VPQPRKTNREVEIKLPVKDLHATVRAIEALGAVSRGRLFEQNTLYDTPQSDLRASGRLLRVRIETAERKNASRPQFRRVVLTSKAPLPQPRGPRKKSRYKERSERELIADPSRNWPSDLAALGFRPSFRYEKYRTSFRLRGLKLHLDLDETPVGTFLELEGPPAEIGRVARALGYPPASYIVGTYWDVYAADCRRRDRVPKNMVFRAK